MDKEKLAQIISEKVDAAVNSSDRPKKFFITENGRGVVDGGDLYNAVFKDVMEVLKIALPEIISAVVPTSGKVSTKK